MSRSVNKVILVGHLGKDAETKFTLNGVAVSSFSLATNRRWKDQASQEWKEETDWHRCTLWRSEKLSQFLTKGKQIYCEGRLHTRSWDAPEGKRYITEVIIEELLLLSGDRGQQAPAPEEPAGGAQGIGDDDVPF